MSELVMLHHNEPMTTSLAIACGAQVDHASVLKLIRNHVEALANFGGVGFEIQPFESNGGKQWRDVYYLNEPQSTLLITFMRNSEIVIKFKVALVKAFFDLRDRVMQTAIPSRDEPLTLSHRADVMVSADRTFRAAVRSGRAAGLRTAQAIRRANAVALGKTGIDILAELDITPEIEREADYEPDNTAARFAADWEEQQIPLPYTACRRRDLCRAYVFWCAKNNVIPLRDRVFYAGLRKSLPRMEWLITGVDGKSARCVIPPGTRTGIISGTWGNHISIETDRFGAALRAWEDMEQEAA